MKITSKELRNKWLSFYKERGHVDCGAVSLIGDGSTGVMFNVAGMQPLMPYLLGEKHPMGTRLCNVQGCMRTVDIEEVGDESHFTFFEMMGNWSLGDYFKKEKTKWTVDFLTKEIGLDINKLCTTVFAGNEYVEKDTEIVQYLLDAGIKKENIFFLKENWWDLPGTVNTPCGPDNEWFYPLNDTPCSPTCNATCECGRWVEIGNDVYMQYLKKEDGSVELLKNKNVDTGFGFERSLIYINGLTDGYKTDLFVDVIEHIEKSTALTYGENKEQTKSMRIIADHIRTSVMLIGDRNGILPSNVGAGYILRRILRRAVRYANKINLNVCELANVAKIFIEKVYNEAYPLLVEKEEYILTEINKEIDKFSKALELGTKEFEKVINGIERKNQFMKQSNPDYIEEKTINGKSAFRLFDTFGFPIEMTIEMAEERGFNVDKSGFDEAFKAHQELARTSSAGSFKGGLADGSEETVRLHTACHMLLAALRKKFGTHIEQKGSNITSERLRFDFNFDRKLTDEEVVEIEQLVNDEIKKCTPVERLEMSFKQAKEQGGYGVHKADENETVSVYKIGDFDFQICGGPHAKNTSELKNFKISKQEAVSAGVRRIKAIINF
ncbi:MAG: alanine--tRNA ligase [Clostridia bacterium]|nr:alanine--tRNA ligase [Clostridia bacterium]